MKKVCVLLSIYKKDSLEHVKEALDSLYNQTIKSDIFVRVDGEIDSNLLKFLQKEYSHHKIKFLVISSKNEGLANSLNELIKIGLKKGYTYFFRMDADDISFSKRFEEQLNFMEKNKEIDICGTFIEEFGDGIEYRKVVKYPLTHQEMFNFFKKRVPLAHVSVCFRDTFFKKAGFYPLNGHISNEDTLLWFEGFKKGCKFANIDYVGVKVRVNNSFFERRRGIKKVWYDFKNRILVNKELGYGIEAYFYSLGMVFVNILPPKLKKLAYKYLR